MLGLSRQGLLASIYNEVTVNAIKEMTGTVFDFSTVVVVINDFGVAGILISFSVITVGVDVTITVITVVIVIVIGVDSVGVDSVDVTVLYPAVIIVILVAVLGTGQQRLIEIQAPQRRPVVHRHCFTWSTWNSALPEPTILV